MKWKKSTTNVVDAIATCTVYFSYANNQRQHYNFHSFYLTWHYEHLTRKPIQPNIALNKKSTQSKLSEKPTRVFLHFILWKPNAILFLFSSFFNFTVFGFHFHCWLLQSIVMRHQIVLNRWKVSTKWIDHFPWIH